MADDARSVESGRDVVDANDVVEPRIDERQRVQSTDIDNIDNIDNIDRHRQT
jgi:hypothetical protein